MATEKFLILGSSSFYGGNFAECVRRHGDEAICRSRPQFDLVTKPDFGIADEGIDYIVNFISRSLVAESWSAPEEWFETNAGALAARIGFLRHFRVRKFIHVSTPESYGHTDGWVDEGHRDWQPSTPYGVSRAAADMMVMAYHRAYRFPAIITRTANIFGIGQPEHRIIPKAFTTIRRGDKLPLDGAGTSRRCFIHVHDACEATYMIAKRGDLGQTYHISSQRDVSIAELIGMIARQLNKRFEDCVQNVPERIGKDAAYLLKSDRIRHMGWRDKIALESGLLEYGH